MKYLNSLQKCEATQSLAPEDKATSRKVMLFDLVSTGHHASYIRHLIRHWGVNSLLGELYVVVSPKFIEIHQDVVQLAASYQDSFIRFVAISAQESVELEKSKTVLDRAFRNIRAWHLLCKYAASLKTDHCIILYLDTCELPLLLKLQPPCPISGIYFRPTFHYKSFANYQPSLRSRLQHLREKLFLHQMLHNHKLHTLFCLDPLVNQSIKEFYPSARAISLADPVEIPNSSALDTQDLREKYRISSNRRIFLLFGSIDERKGIYKLLEVLEHSPSELCQKLCFLVVGNASSSDKKTIQLKIDAVTRSKPVQFVTQFEFVPEQEVQAYFQLADFVLAIYQKHVGMSGILLLAAAAQKPVLSTNYGLMGELTQKHGLGLAVDSTCTKSIEQGLAQMIELPEKSFLDISKTKLFVEANTVDKFTEAIFSVL